MEQSNQQILTFISLKQLHNFFLKILYCSSLFVLYFIVKEKSADRTLYFTQSTAPFLLLNILSFSSLGFVIYVIVEQSRQQIGVPLLISLKQLQHCCSKYTFFYLRTFYLPHCGAEKSEDLSYFNSAQITGVVSGFFSYYKVEQRNQQISPRYFTQSTANISSLNVHCFSSGFFIYYSQE